MASISLRSNNPYSNPIGYIINYPEGDQSLERFKVNYVASDKDKLHTITEFDTLWNISFDYYGDSKFWWLIADANDIENPFEITPNSNIIIPDIDRIKAMVL